MPSGKSARRRNDFFFDAVVEPTRTQVMNQMKDYERVVLQVVTWHP